MRFPWDRYEELPLSKRNTLQIFITNKCNLKCDGCFARNIMAENDEDLSISEYRIAIRNGIAREVKQINILGGEPLLHSKLDSMCLFNRRHELKTTIYTNGIRLEKYDIKYFHDAKLRVSLDSFMRTQKSCTKLLGKGWIQYIDANFMTTTKTSADELVASAKLLEAYGCKVFFIFNKQELENEEQEFFNSDDESILSVLEYKKLVHEFLEMYDGDMEIHISKRGVFESTLSLPHNKCKFANYFIGGKIIQCPYDVVNLKYQDDYEFDSRYCQQNSTCLMSKIIVKRK